MGHRITAARKRPARTSQGAVVPDVVIDACEKTFEAADESAEKSNGLRFDDNGLFAVVCRHDIPIFLANIDTPGEQQKYMVALAEHIMSLLPSRATVVFLYDIGCVLSRSLRKVYRSELRNCDPH